MIFTVGRDLRNYILFRFSNPNALRGQQNLCEVISSATVELEVMITMETREPGPT